jgi:hypothetical protein
MQLQRQKRYPSREIEVLTISHVEPADVLPRDVSIRADVDDVNPLDTLDLELPDCTGDKTARNESLSEPNFVSDQESASGRLVVVESIEDVVDGLALKVLESRENRTWVE